MEHSDEVPDRGCRSHQRLEGMDNEQREILLGFIQTKGCVEALLWIRIHGGVHMSELFVRTPEVLGAGRAAGYLHVDDNGDVQLTDKGSVIAGRLVELFA